MGGSHLLLCAAQTGIVCSNGLSSIATVCMYHTCAFSTCVVLHVQLVLMYRVRVL